MNSLSLLIKEASSKKIAIIHNSLWQMRGAERVLLIICKIFPNADLFVLFGSEGRFPAEIKDRKITYSFLQKLPWIEKYNRLTLPLWPIAVEQFDLSKYDIVISLNSSVSKGVISGINTLHLAYIFTPMRFLWDLKDVYWGSFSNIIKIFAAPVFSFLRVWDIYSSRRPDQIIAISNLVKMRLEKYHGVKVDSVLFPPVELREVDRSVKREEWFLALSPYRENKGGKLLEKLAEELEITIKVSGNYIGSDLGSRSGAHIEWLGWISEGEKWDLFRKAKCLFVLGIEDFGLAPLEALSVGCPVIALKGSGFVEAIQDSDFESIGLIIIEDLSIDAIRKAISRIDQSQSSNGLNAATKALLTEDYFSKEFLKNIK